MKRRAKRAEIRKLPLGLAYAVIGDRDKALDWLGRAFEGREPDFRNHIRTPAAKTLRGDPRYAELLSRLKRGFDDLPD